MKFELKKSFELRWLQVGRAEIFIRGWQWSWRNVGNFLTVAIPGIVIRYKKY